MKHAVWVLGLGLWPLAGLSQSPHPNVLVSTRNSPNETAIAINPKNTQQLVAGANLNNQYASLDGGQTWTWTRLTSPYSVWGDPVVVADTTGAFYYFHLSNPATIPTYSFPFIDRLLVQRTAAAGAPFAFRSFFGLNPPKQQDKEWVAVDRRTNTLYATWTEFDEYGSMNVRDSTRILFSKSDDQAQTWSAPQRISFYGGDAVDEDNTVEGAVPAVGPNGEVYVAWAGPRGIVFNRSLNAGLTWLPRERTVVNQPGGWDYAVPGVYRANGLPVTVCDAGRGPYRGTIYVNWTDQRNGPTDTDVWVARSQDGGQTWSAPVRVNDDAPGHHQFFTWLTVDQATGHLWCVFYDRRNYSAPADLRTDVYGARSTDGGRTWQNFRLSQSPFVPDEQEFLGDYTNITAHNNVVRPVWTRMDNRQTSVWTALVNVPVLSTPRAAAPAGVELTSYPNPARSVLNLAVQAPVSTTATFWLRSPDGRLMRTLTEPVGPTQRVLSLPVDDLAAGAYLLEADLNGQRLHRKVLVAR